MRNQSTQKSWIYISLLLFTCSHFSDKCQKAGIRNTNPTLVCKEKLILHRLKLGDRLFWTWFRYRWQLSKQSCPELEHAARFQIIFWCLGHCCATVRPWEAPLCDWVSHVSVWLAAMPPFPFVGRPGIILSKKSGQSNTGRRGGKNLTYYREVYGSCYLQSLSDFPGSAVFYFFFVFVFPFCRLRAALKNYFLHLTEKPDILSSSTHMNDRLSFPLCCLCLCLSRSDILCCAS